MAGPNHRFRKWALWRPRDPDAEELIARAQRLVDTPRPPEGYSLEWCVEAKHVGDLTAIAVAALRDPIQHPAAANSRNGTAEPT